MIGRRALTTSPSAASPSTAPQVIHTPLGSRLLLVSGQIPVGPDGTLPEGFEAQCRQVWANIFSTLDAAGMSPRDLVKVTTFLSDREYRHVNSAVRRELLGDHEPAVTVIVAGIYEQEWLLEIEAVAAAPATNAVTAAPATTL